MHMAADGHSDEAYNASLDHPPVPGSVEKHRAKATPREGAISTRCTTGRHVAAMIDMVAHVDLRPEQAMRRGDCFIGNQRRNAATNRHVWNSNCLLTWIRHPLASLLNFALL